jgi:hypothetical protein
MLQRIGEWWVQETGVGVLVLIVAVFALVVMVVAAIAYWRRRE